MTVTAVSDTHVNAADGVDASQTAVAALVASTPSDAVLMPGDLSDTGTAADFNTFNSLYGSVKNKIRPAPGNHDYSATDGSAYFNYFGPSNGTISTPWYSFDLGAWHIVSFEAAPDPGAPNYWSASSPQLQWLTADLDAHAGQPTLAEFHAPRYSGAEHGDSTDLTAIWNILYTHHVELAINGHEHAYQRFAPQNASGQAESDGVREIIVATGGAAHYAMSNYTSGHNLQAWNNTDYGVTTLTLGPTSYSWKFTASDGSGWTDSGTSPVNPEHLPSGNQAPVADAGPDQTVTAGSNGTANVTLNGTNSSDPDGDALTYQWTENGTTLATTAQPTVSLPVGIHTITLTVTDPSGLTGTDTVVITVNAPPPVTNPSTTSHGYWLVGSDGGIFSFNAPFFGSTGSMLLQRSVVGVVPTKDHAGYWLDASDGGVFSFGDTVFYGSIPGLGIHPYGSGLPHSLNAPVVGMVPSADQGGYFMVASDGGVFAFGDAKFAGSCYSVGGCVGAAVAVMPDASGNGYWVVTQTGNVYGFGDASNFGGPGNTGSPVTSAVRTPSGNGYWVLTANGNVYAYGDAKNAAGAPGAFGRTNPATAVFTTSDNSGYWIASANGSVYPVGGAPFYGSMAGTRLNGSIIAATGF